MYVSQKLVMARSPLTITFSLRQILCRCACHAHGLYLGIDVTILWVMMLTERQLVHGMLTSMGSGSATAALFVVSIRYLSGTQSTARDNSGASGVAATERDCSRDGNPTLVSV